MKKRIKNEFIHITFICIIAKEKLIVHKVFFEFVIIDILTGLLDLKNGCVHVCVKRNE